LRNLGGLMASDKGGGDCYKSEEAYYGLFHDCVLSVSSNFIRFCALI
jgi:hypothetical protein